VEIAGALKNAYAIGAGLIDGYEMGINIKSAFVIKAT